MAIGEIGLDYHYDFAPRDVQREVFAAQVALAVERDLPVVIHTREATDDTMAVLREAGGGRVRGVMHCFSGTLDEARQALDLGFYISLSGILTFPEGRRAARGRATACRPIACWSKPTRRFWRRCRTAASATNRRGSRDAARRWPACAASTPDGAGGAGDGATSSDSLALHSELRVGALTPRRTYGLIPAGFSR